MLRVFRHAATLEATPNKIPSLPRLQLMLVGNYISTHTESTLTARKITARTQIVRRPVRNLFLFFIWYTPLESTRSRTRSCLARGSRRFGSKTCRSPLRMVTEASTALYANELRRVARMPGLNECAYGARTSR